MSWIDDYHVSFIALEQELEKVKHQLKITRAERDHFQKWMNNYEIELNRLKGRDVKEQD